MPNVPWAPPGSNPALTSVLAFPQRDLRWSDYLELVAARVHDLIREAGKEAAQEQIKAYLPHHHDFLDQPPNQWAAELLEAGELVRTRLAENIPGHWPQRVNGPNPWAKRALENVDLESWLNLAVPREPEQPTT